MKRPSILSGVAFALATTLAAIPLWSLASASIPFPLSLRLMSALVYLAFVGHSIWTRKSRVGSITLGLANLLVAVALPFTPLPTPALITVLALLVSVNRSLLWHRTMPAVALDVALVALGAFFAGYLRVHPLSFSGPLWGFALLQSLWPLIPPSPTSEDDPTPEEAVEPFVHGQRQADAALQRLMEREGV